jgi:hypothetical protein
VLPLNDDGSISSKFIEDYTNLRIKKEMELKMSLNGKIMHPFSLDVLSTASLTITTISSRRFAGDRLSVCKADFVTYSLRMGTTKKVPIVKGPSSLSPSCPFF